MAFGTLAAGLLALVAEAIVVNKAVRCLASSPDMRSVWRYALVGFGLVHIAIIVGCVLYALFFK